MAVDFIGVTYLSPRIDDDEALGWLPDALRRFLQQANGLVAFHGGLHVRGACHEPLWHALRHVWRDERAFHARYPGVSPSDIPFAEDAVGDQWLLRDERLIRLEAETGEIKELGQSFEEFLLSVEQDPVDTLGLHPLMQFQAEGRTLSPGQLLSVYPPFCTAEAAQGVDLRAVPSLERLDFLADLARQLPPDGEFRIRVD